MKQKNERQGRLTRRATYVLCLAAFLAALSFLLGLLAKTIQGTSPLRVTLEGMPVVLSGMMLGPLVGAAVGVAADLLSCLLAGQSPLPLITVGAALLGFVPGLLTPLLYRGARAYTLRPRFLTVLLLDGAAHAVGSVTVKSIALSAFYGFNTLVLRAPIDLGITLLESYRLYLLLRSADVRRELERLLK